MSDDATPGNVPLSDLLGLRWAEAPRRTEYGAGMMEALVALGKDHTLRLYAEAEALHLVEQALRGDEVKRLEQARDTYFAERNSARDAWRSRMTEAERLREALTLAVHAMRAPLDDWKGEVERKALDAAAAALNPTRPASDLLMPREAIAALWNSLPIDMEAEAIVSFVRGVERWHGLAP